MIEVVTDLKSLQRLEHDWDRLAAASGSPMQQYDWFYHCAESVCDQSSLRILVYRDGTAAKAIAPLVRARRNNVSWLEIMGAAELYEPSGLLYEDLASLRALLRAIAGQGLPVNLQRIATTSPIGDAARAACRGLLLIRSSAGSCHIPIASDWENFFQSLGNSRRTDFRKKRQRAENLGVLSVDVVCPDEATLEERLNECFRIEAASWKGRYGSALRDNPRLHDFFRRYCATASRKGILRLFFYAVGGQPVAMHLGVEYARKLWIYKLGHDEAWSRISPGMHLANETIRYAFEHKLDGYEFLGSGEAWQHAWPVATHDYCSILIYPFSWQGVRGIWDSAITLLRNRVNTAKQSDRSR